jgi:hypothetical protein
MPRNKLSHALAVCALALLSGACSTTPPADSGFLQHPERLAATGDERQASFVGPVRQPWRTLRVAAIDWRLPAESDALTRDEKARLRDTLSAALETEFAPLVHRDGERAVVIRAAITHVSVASPALNTLSAIFLFVPLDPGGAAVELEAVDAVTGEVVAAMSATDAAGITDFKGHFGRLDHPEMVLREAAHDFRELLEERHVAEADNP